MYVGVRGQLDRAQGQLNRITRRDASLQHTSERAKVQNCASWDAQNEGQEANLNFKVKTKYALALLWQKPCKANVYVVRRGGFVCNWSLIEAG